MSIQLTTTRRATVEAYDEAVGLGTLRDQDRGDEHPFHCTAIGDGSRSIAVGTVVTYRPVPGRHGRVEATDVWPVGAQG